MTSFFALYSLCRGYTLYKLLHYWSEIFSLERLVNVGRQIAQVSYKLVQIFYLFLLLGNGLFTCSWHNSQRVKC